MSKIFQVIYASTGRNLFTEKKLNNLLEESRSANLKIGITGLLAYKDGNFMQSLEGQEQKVIELMQKISRDTRHFGIILMCKGFVERREFSNWSMAYLNLSGDPSEGFSDFLTPDKSEHEKKISAGKAKILMLNFRKLM
jgi:hypothetical protein